MSEVSKDTPRTRLDGEQTRRKILRVAERLFAQDGYEGVSVRRITSESGVELSAVNYHFKSKENLFHSVLAMRVDAINRRRISMIGAVKLTEDVESSLRAILNAFCLPFTDSSSTEDLSNYRQLLAHVINTKRWQAKTFQHHFDPIVQMLIANISQLVEFDDEEDVYWYISFFLGALANAFAETGRVDRISGGICDSSNLDKVKDKLIDFTVGGLMQNCHAGKEKSGAT